MSTKAYYTGIVDCQRAHHWLPQQGARLSPPANFDEAQRREWVKGWNSAFLRLRPPRKR